MSDAYVGFSATPVDSETLNQLIDSCVENDGLLFLRWPHRVKMLPASKRAEIDFKCQQGQAFNQTKELRWKPKGDGYEVLLLSDDGGDALLSPLGGEKKRWATNVSVLDAKAYPKTETRLPRQVTIPGELNLGQRYFIDAETGCVQFVALRVKEDGSK